ncbi:MAG: ATP-binding protein [Methylococcaceae bacterium]|jgi:MoxR-like ATPase
MGDSIEIEDDLVQLARLAVNEQTDDVHLFVARLVRKYRGVKLGLAEQMELYLRSKPARGGSVMRKTIRTEDPPHPMPVDNESRMSLLKVFNDNSGAVQLLLSPELEDSFSQIIQERKQSDRLASLDLLPTRSAIFVGKPGVGKTLTARWPASKLGLPLYVLVLTTVMSSLLGKTGSNLRAALDFSKQAPCVLLLDEIDAIAKKRNDDTDIGELKRLVTVMLQEVDEWPPSGLLLAATNHPELIDPALWRRFDIVIEFKLPALAQVKEAVTQFLGPDLPVFKRWLDILVLIFSGESFSDIERSIQRFRRTLALSASSDSDVIEELVKTKALTLEHQQRIDVAIGLAQKTKLSQHKISEITGVSRDTLRKYAGGKASSKKGKKNDSNKFLDGSRRIIDPA